MGAVLSALGVFFWFVFSLTDFIFFLPNTLGFSQRFRSAVIINLQKNTGRDSGIQFMKLIALFWVLIGLLFIIFDVRSIGGVSEEIILGFLFLIPVWVVALIMERRRKL